MAIQWICQWGRWGEDACRESDEELEYEDAEAEHHEVCGPYLVTTIDTEFNTLMEGIGHVGSEFKSDKGIVGEGGFNHPEGNKPDA